MAKHKASRAVWHTAPISDGDFSATGTDLGYLADGTGDFDPDGQTFGTALGDVSAGATIGDEVRTLSTTALVTMQTAEDALTVGYLFLLGENGKSYRQIGPCVCSMALATGPKYGAAERSGARYRFSGRHGEAHVLSQTIEGTITPPAGA